MPFLYLPTVLHFNFEPTIAYGTTVSECWFDNNVGLAVSQSVGSSRFVNCVFSRNKTSVLFVYFGSIIGDSGEFFSNQSFFFNCTFFENGNVTAESTVFSVRDSGLDVQNSIFWGNDGVLVRRTNSGDRSAFRVRNSVVEGGFEPSNISESAIDIIDADPLLVAPGLGNFRLRPGSPAIDAGLETDAPATDFDGAPRPVGDGVDIGAFEFDPKTFHDPYDTDGNGAVNALDIQRVVNQVLGMPTCPLACDIDGDGLFDAVDVQFIINAAMGIR